jgi:MFS family permease
MYLTLRDRPMSDRRGPRQRVAGTVLLLGIVSMFTDISTESVNAVLPLYLVSIVGLSPQAFGFVNGLYNGVSAVIRIFGGWVSDRADRPKWVAFVGYFVSAISRIGLLFATGLTSISLIITGDRLGKGLRTAPRDAIIAAASPPESLGRAYGVHRSLDSLGSAIGPLIAFWVLSVVVNGFHTVFVVSLAFATVGVAILLLVVPDLRLRRSRRSSAPTTSPASTVSPASPAPVEIDGSAEAADSANDMIDPDTALPKSGRLNLKLLANPGLARLLVAASLLGLLTVGDNFLYIQLQLREDLANRYYPLLMVGMNVAYLLVAIPLGRLADRVGRAKVFIGGHIALLICYLCAAGPFVGPVLSVGCLAMLGVYYAATDGTLAALSGRIVDPSVRTSSIATAQTFQALASFVSSVVVGLLWSQLGLTDAILWYAPVLLAGIPVAAYVLRGMDRRQKSLVVA